MREMVQPFNLETFRATGQFLDNQTDVLNDLYRRIGGRSKEIGIALHGAMVLIKKVPVALGLEQEMLREHLEWEVEQLLPASVNDYILEYQKLPFQTLEGNPVFLLILVRKQIVDGIRTLMKNAGLTLKEIDVDAFTNIRALLANYDVNSEETTVLVDIQRENIVFFFIRHREYFLSHRTLIHEGRSSTQLIESSDIVHSLLKEFRRIVFGHRLGQSIEDLDRIFLMGSDAIQTIAQELSASVSVPIEIVNPFRRVGVSESVTKSKEYIRFPDRFMSSVGVTLRRVSTLAQ